eukprot:CAMPEP_0119304344 /NCGR_PEP_ID=MMETSP1333-20130426/5583_1 /TAXON_ID=418940 /ORGANISM="Scyphosphaera apsteinii, Strain RCC1455" /LENGTH=373 /DNA_ID=CAMNT_0007307203 /DNA_START=9 /DNA_END=1130 /DNA_ORIENTATION=+
MTRSMTQQLLLSTLVADAAAHGAVISPRARQSIDYLVGVNVPKDWPSDRGCINVTGGACNNGQAPFWYSQGCFIGCPECDHLSGRRQVDLCGLGKKATINDPALRTVNRNVTAGSELDIYKHNPWRAPGTAPVGDACGLAGGTPWKEEVSEAGDYTTTKFAHHGMNGTKLPPLDTGVVWTLGLEAEVTWQIENNHGGGYTYRLCPADAPLTEACFQAHPLEFVSDKQAIVFQNGTLLPIKGIFTREGTHPAGSMWARLPIPSNGLGPNCLPGPNDTAATMHACQPWEKEIAPGAPCAPCPGTPGSDCSRCDNGPVSYVPPCDGCVGNDHHHAIRDVVKVPTDLPPGKYVLGWRWDCEATAQVWSSCSDITLVR